MILHEICAIKSWDFDRLLEHEQDIMAQDYLENILKEGSWCGSETIAAVTRIYRADIIIYTVDSDPWCFTVPDAELRIELLFSGLVQKNHYDVIVKVEMYSNTDEMILPTTITQPKTNENDGQYYQYQESDDNTDPESSAGVSLFMATVTAWLGSHLHEWQLDINALNLRKAAIKELSCNLDYYKAVIPSFSRTHQAHFNDILTHWNEENTDVDIQVGRAIAEILQAEFVIHAVNGEEVKFLPHSRQVLRKITIREVCNGFFVPEPSSHLDLSEITNSMNSTTDNFQSTSAQSR